MIDKDSYNHIQNIFKKALIYEFELSRRDSTFFKSLKEVTSFYFFYSKNSIIN